MLAHKRVPQLPGMEYIYLGINSQQGSQFTVLYIHWELEPNAAAKSLHMPLIFIYNT